MNLEQARGLVKAAVREAAGELNAIGEYIWKNPEPGYREKKTSAKLVEELTKLGLEVKTDDGGGQTTDFGEVVIEDKGQIGLAAAKVDDGDILTTMLANGIIDHLDKTVDLTVFVLHFFDF